MSFSVFTYLRVPEGIHTLSLRLGASHRRKRKHLPLMLSPARLCQSPDSALAAPGTRPSQQQPAVRASGGAGCKFVFPIVTLRGAWPPAARCQPALPAAFPGRPAGGRGLARLPPPPPAPRPDPSRPPRRGPPPGRRRLPLPGAAPSRVPGRSAAGPEGAALPGAAPPRAGDVAPRRRRRSAAAGGLPAPPGPARPGPALPGPLGSARLGPAPLRSAPRRERPAAARDPAPRRQAGRPRGAGSGLREAPCPGSAAGRGRPRGDAEPRRLRAALPGTGQPRRAAAGDPGRRLVPRGSGSGAPGGGRGLAALPSPPGAWSGGVPEPLHRLRAAQPRLASPRPALAGARQQPLQLAGESWPSAVRGWGGLRDASGGVSSGRKRVEAGTVQRRGAARWGFVVSCCGVGRGVWPRTCADRCRQRRSPAGVWRGARGGRGLPGEVAGEGEKMAVRGIREKRLRCSAEGARPPSLLRFQSRFYFSFWRGGSGAGAALPFSLFPGHAAASSRSRAQQRSRPRDLAPGSRHLPCAQGCRRGAAARAEHLWFLNHFLFQLRSEFAKTCGSGDAAFLPSGYSQALL